MNLKKVGLNFIEQMLYWGFYVKNVIYREKKVGVLNVQRCKTVAIIINNPLLNNEVLPDINLDFKDIDTATTVNSTRSCQIFAKLIKIPSVERTLPRFHHHHLRNQPFNILILLSDRNANITLIINYIACTFNNFAKCVLLSILVCSVNWEYVYLDFNSSINCSTPSRCFRSKSATIGPWIYLDNIIPKLFKHVLFSFFVVIC